MYRIETIPSSIQIDLSSKTREYNNNFERNSELSKIKNLPKFYMNISSDDPLLKYMNFRQNFSFSVYVRITNGKHLKRVFLLIIRNDCIIRELVK